MAEATRPKTSRRVLLGICSLIALPLVVRSAPADPDGPYFDQAAVADGYSGRLDVGSRLLKMMAPLMTPKRPNPDEKALPKGPIVGVPIPGRILGSEPYKRAAEYPPLFGQLQPEIAEPLKAEWESINQTRGELLAEANKLENRDSQLYQQGVALDENADRLLRRKAQLEQAVDDWNRTCVGRPLPPDEYQRCINRRGQIERDIQEFNGQVREHNAAVDAWRSAVADLRVIAGQLFEGIKRWEDSKVRPFIDRAEKAMSEGPVSAVRIQAQTGSVVEASQAMNKPKPITLSEGLRLLDAVWSLLTDRQRASRVVARQKAEAFMRGVAVGGGIGPTWRSFYDHEPHRGDDPRIDVEVLWGRAFVQDCCR